MLDLQKAQQELAEKNLNQIQTETAWTWASRAAASYEQCLATEGVAKLAWWSCGEEYFHEALEHAALVEGEDIISKVKQELIQYQEKAAQNIDQVFGNGQEDHN